MSSEQLFANGRIAVLSNKLLTPDKYLRLAESSSVAEAVRQLSEWGYDATNCDDCEQMLRRSLDATLSEVKELCTSQNALRFLLCKYDYHNAKALMKGKYMRLDFGDSCYANAFYPVSDMSRAFVDDDYSLFTKNMATACDAIDAEFADGRRSAQVIDRTLDKAYFADLRHFARLSASKLLVRLAEAQADAVNVSLVPRFKKAGMTSDRLREWLIEGGRIKHDAIVALFNGEISARELPEEYRQLAEDGDVEAALAVVRKQLLDYADPMTLQPALQYFYAKVAETESVRRIVADVKNGVDKEKIKEKINANAR